MTEHRRLRFSLRTLLLMTTLVAVQCGIFSWGLESHYPAVLGLALIALFVTVPTAIMLPFERTKETWSVWVAVISGTAMLVFVALVVVMFRFIVRLVNAG